MKTKSIIKNKLGLFLLLTLVLSFGCAKKKTNLRETPKQTSAVTTGTGANAAGANVLNQNTKKQADSVAAANGVSIDWVGTNLPYDGVTGDNQPYFMVVNIFNVNGQRYEFPTVHYYQNTTPIDSLTMYYTIDGVDMDLDAQCFDRNCREYVLSYKISKESQNLKQIMIYIDFTNQIAPIISVNDSSHFMSIPQFSDAIRSLF